MCVFTKAKQETCFPSKIRNTVCKKDFYHNLAMPTNFQDNTGAVNLVTAHGGFGF